jgi:hypothetical protein
VIRIYSILYNLSYIRYCFGQLFFRVSYTPPVEDQNFLVRHECFVLISVTESTLMASKRSIVYNFMMDRKSISLKKEIQVIVRNFVTFGPSNVKSSFNFYILDCCVPNFHGTTYQLFYLPKRPI